jgi:3',5'-cyclic-AMP phosphodiesterase
MKRLNSILLVPFCLVMLSCNHWFEYSPYDTDIKKKHLNSEEISDIEMTVIQSDTLKFAVIADIHDNYDDLSAAIKRINLHQDLTFVVCCGDITNSGLAQQFEWFIEVIEKSRIPIITLIGNHDYRSNGSAIFKKAFGPVNFSFKIEEYEFVLFDNTIWENNNRSPQYDWLENELNNDSEDISHIVICHIPPWGDQMKGNHESLYCNVVNQDNTLLSIHGHTHNHKEIIYQGIYALVSDAINDRTYSIVSLCEKNISIKTYSF